MTAAEKENVEGSRGVWGSSGDENTDQDSLARSFKKCLGVV